MDLKGCWWFWIILILLIIIFFPKTCGTIKESSTFEYQCHGIKISNFLKNSSNSYNLCSGFCSEKLKQKTNSTKPNYNDPNSPKQVSNIFNKVKIWLIPLFIVIISIIFLKIFLSLKNKTAEIKQG